MRLHVHVQNSVLGFEHLARIAFSRDHPDSKTLALPYIGLPHMLPGGNRIRFMPIQFPKLGIVVTPGLKLQSVLQVLLSTLLCCICSNLLWSLDFLLCSLVPKHTLCRAEFKQIDWELVNSFDLKNNNKESLTRNLHYFIVSVMGGYLHRRDNGRRQYNLLIAIEMSVKTHTIEY